MIFFLYVFYFYFDVYFLYVYQSLSYINYEILFIIGNQLELKKYFVRKSNIVDRYFNWLNK